MRPRVIYCAAFTWYASTGGRFEAPYLQRYLPLSSSIGTILACQTAIISFLGGFGGRLADDWERRNPHQGRMDVLKLGIFLGVFFSIIEGLGNVFIPTGRSTHSIFLNRSLIFWWNLVLRSGYAVAFALTAPVLDGLTVAHLKQGGGGAESYGKERLHGALWWAIANLIIGIMCDQFGFDIALFLATMVSSVACYTVLSIYEADTVSTEIILPVHETSSLLQPNGLIQNDSKSEAAANQETDKSYSLLTLLSLAFSTPYRTAFSVTFLLLNMGMVVAEKLIFLFYTSILGSSNTM